MTPVKVKNYRVSGYYIRQRRKFQFTKYARALNKEKAREKVLSKLNLGKTKSEIRFTKIEEIPGQEITNETLKKVALEKDPIILGRE